MKPNYADIEKGEPIIKGIKIKSFKISIKFETLKKLFTMKKLKVLMVVALVGLTSIVFGQEVAPVQEATKFDLARIWEIIKIASPYIAGLFIALFGTSEGMADNPNIKANSVKQFIWQIWIKLAKKEAAKLKK